MNLKDKVVLITGGAKRIGKVIALRLARDGAKVAISYRHSKAEAKDTVHALKEIGVDADAFHADLCKMGHIEHLIKDVIKRFGTIDVLINNAAVYYKTPLDTVREAEWDDTVDSNLKGPFWCATLASRHMKKMGGGKIINISDWAGWRPYQNYVPYCITKAGIIAMTQGMAKSLAPEIQVNSVAPGPVLAHEELKDAERENIIAKTPLNRFGSPDDIAETVHFLLTGSDFITGAVVPVDGGRSIY